MGRGFLPKIQSCFILSSQCPAFICCFVPLLESFFGTISFSPTRLGLVPQGGQGGKQEGGRNSRTCPAGRDGAISDPEAIHLSFSHIQYPEH